jgi:hypothetical protein
MELSETYRVSCQNKFVKLVHLVGFIIKKFVTMHGHMNVKFVNLFVFICRAFLHLSLKLGIKVNTVPIQASAVCRFPGG